MGVNDQFALQTSWIAHVRFRSLADIPQGGLQNSFAGLARNRRLDAVPGIGATLLPLRVVRGFEIGGACNNNICALLGEPTVFRDPLLGFCLGSKLAEEMRIFIRPLHFDAPIARLCDGCQHYGQTTSPRFRGGYFTQCAEFGRRQLWPGLINSAHHLRAAVLAAYSAKRDLTSAISSIIKRSRAESIARASLTHFAAQCRYASQLSTSMSPLVGS